MISVVIKGPAFEEAYQQIKLAIPYADLVELRLDYFNFLDFPSLARLRAHFSIPMIFTLRSQRQGGSYTQSEDNRLKNIHCLLELKPEFLDLEYDIEASFIEEIALKYPGIKLILSYHNFEETPKDLEGIYQKMLNPSAFFYKMAVTANSSLDALRFLAWAKHSHDRLIAVSMGEHGQISRILGPVIGNPITYAALNEDQKSAPGQLTAKTLIEKYRYYSLSPKTTIYGLIGDPIDQSISDETHNFLIKTLGIEAVYIKIQVSQEELPDFLTYAKDFSFKGLSVTMPLKEAILPFLDAIDLQALAIGAVNTLVFDRGKISGFNTDGIGALNAIERHFLVNNKKMMIIGAGGAAKAIAYEAHKRGALVTIVNRDKTKAQEIAERLSLKGVGLDSLSTCFENCDILINSTPISFELPKTLSPSTLVMDIKSKPKETVFLLQAIRKGCCVVFGYEMFVEQAACQFKLWLNPIDLRQIKEILETSAKSCFSEIQTLSI